MLKIFESHLCSCLHICLLEETPTAHITLSKTKQTVEMLNEKINALEEKVESLTEERNYLRERLEDGKFPLHSRGLLCNRKERLLKHLKYKLQIINPYCPLGMLFI